MIMIIETEFVKAPADTAPFAQAGLGRVPAIDERSHLPRFAMAAPQSDRTSRNWLSPKWGAWPAVLNQGQTSECVAYSLTKLQLAHRIANKPVMLPNQLYRRAQDLDEWPGSDYNGTSVNGGLKALHEVGVITRWTWAFENESIIRHILEVGPVVVGTDWTNDMFNLSQGYLWPTGDLVGGHAYLLLGVNRQRRNPDDSVGAYRVLNSWGPRWGQGGRAWISFDSMQKLLNGISRWPGEAAAVDEVDLVVGG